MPEKRLNPYARAIEVIASTVCCVSGVFMVHGSIGYAEAKEKTDALPVTPVIQMAGCLLVSVVSGAIAAHYHEA